MYYYYLYIQITDFIYQVTNVYHECIIHPIGTLRKASSTISSMINDIKGRNNFYSFLKIGFVKGRLLAKILRCLLYSTLLVSWPG